MTQYNKNGILLTSISKHFLEDFKLGNCF